MAEPIKNATTWIFSHQLVVPAAPAPEIALCSSLADSTRVQYLAFQVDHNNNNDSTYIRGVLRCYVNSSYKQVSALLPSAYFKPLRGVFSAGTVFDKLRHSSRVGKLYEFGSLTLGAKRTYTLESCPTCGCDCPNKRVKI